MENKNQSINIIGDIHGRTNWEEVVSANGVNVFLGDYFDPYKPYGFEDMKNNFLNIIALKEARPETVLLLGNHDLHYIYGAESSRYMYEHATEIKQLFQDNLKHFHGIAYCAHGRVLATHAGVSSQWLARHNYAGEMNPDALANWINKQYAEKRYECFQFEPNAEPWDHCGDSPTQGPTWIRPEALVENNALPNDYQVVGHTQVPFISSYARVVLVDCLGRVPASLLIDPDLTFHVMSDSISDDIIAID